MGLLVISSLAARRPLGLLTGPLGWSTLGLLVPLLISAWISDDQARGWSEWTSLWPLLFLFLTAAIVRDAQRPRWFLFSLLASTTVSCLPTLQHIWADLRQFGELKHTLHPYTNIWLYTLAVCSGCFAALYACLTSTNRRGQVVAGTIFVVHFVAIYGTRRRMLLLVAAGMVVVTLAARFAPRLGKARWPVLTLGSLVLLGVPMLLDHRVVQLLDFSKVAETERSRLEMWKFGIAQFEQNPLLGTGVGDLRAELHAHADAIEPQLREQVGLLPNGKPVPINLHHSHCHSNFIHTMAVAGTLGLVGLLQWLGCLMACLFRFRRAAPQAFYLGLSAWALFVFGGVTDASLYSSSRLAAFTLLFGYAWGLGLRALRSGDAAHPHHAVVD